MNYCQMNCNECNNDIFGINYIFRNSIWWYCTKCGNKIKTDKFRIVEIL